MATRRNEGKKIKRHLTKYYHCYMYIFDWADFAIITQRRMVSLVQDDWKSTVTQITTHYNKGMKKTISEHTTHPTLKQMGYSSRRPHQVPLLSANNRKLRLQFTQAHQNWTIEDWKNHIQMVGSEFGSMDPSCLVSTLQAAAGGVMVWGIFFLAHFGPLSTNCLFSSCTKFPSQA